MSTDVQQERYGEAISLLALAKGLLEEKCPQQITDLLEKEYGEWNQGVEPETFYEWLMLVESSEGDAGD